MQPLRHRINPKTFVITLRQLAKHLKINQERILNWEKWHNVLWVHIQGLGGYFISYRLPRTVDCRLPYPNPLLPKSGSPQRSLVTYPARSRTLHRRSVKRSYPEGNRPTRSNLAATTNRSMRSPTDITVHELMQ